MPKQKHIDTTQNVEDKNTFTDKHKAIINKFSDAEREDLMTNFLRDFWEPLLTLYEPKKKLDWISIKYRKYETIKSVILKNKSYPIWWHFTPNWNFWNNFVQWATISYTSDKAHKPYYNALCVDIDWEPDDERHWKNKTELLNRIKETINQSYIKPRYIVETNRWYHLYWIIERSDRSRIHKDFWSEIFKISKYIRDVLKWDTDFVCSTNISWTARLPYTIYYDKKTLEARGIVEIIETNNEYLWYNQIKWLLNFIDEQKKIDSNTKKTYSKNIDKKEYNEIESIPIPDIIKCLPDRSFNWTPYNIKLEWTAIHIINKKNNAIIKTDWYKYWKQKNRIVSFSKESHTRNERPYWWVLAFVTWWFKSDYLKIHKFFEENFWIRSIIKTNEEAIFIDKEIDVWDSVIQFTKNWVYMITKKAVIILFRNKINIIGKAKTKLWIDFKERRQAITVFVYKDTDWELWLLHFISTKRDFNKKYWSNMFFFWSDNDLWTFYYALEQAEWIPRLNLLEDSAILENKVILWSKVLLQKKEEENEIDNKESYILTRHNINIYEWKQIPVSKYVDILSKIYKRHNVIPAVLEMIAMSALWVWQDNIIYPSMLLTWSTTVGKTTFAEILKQMVWYAKHTRRYSFNSISPKPLAENATTNAILHLEELTWDFKSKTEWRFRDIINQDKWSIWTLWKSEYYNYKSPMLVTWERTSWIKSLNNRMIILSIESSAKDNWYNSKETFDIIQELYTYTAYEDIYWELLKNRDILNRLYQDAKRKLIEHIDPRFADVWWYVFAIWNLYPILCTKDELIWYINKNIESLRPESKKWLKPATWQLSTLLLKWILNRKLHLYKHESSNVYTFLITDNEYREKNRAKFWNIIYKVNDLSDDWLERIAYDWDSIDIYIKKENPATIDKTLMMIINQVTNNLPYKKHNVV